MLTRFGLQGLFLRVIDDLSSDPPAAPAFPLHFDREICYVSCRSETGESMNERIELPQGTLDLLILRTLALYAALHWLERRGWIKAHWGRHPSAEPA